ncbi:MAG: hypothetical protein ACM3VW_03820, partial [Bacteroidota bacterium]
YRDTTQEDFIMKRRFGNILAFLLPALLAYQVGLLALGRHLVDWNSLAAAAHAFDVFHKLPQANMALIGFVQPPLPALLYLPLSYLFPHWLAAGYCAPLIGAIFLGLSALTLVHLGQALRLQWWLYAPVAALFVIHPLVLSYAALGHPGIILIFAYLGLGKGMVGWHRNQTVRDLISAAIYGAVAILIAYEAIVPVLAAAWFILGCCRRPAAPPESATPAPAKAEGTLIAFLLPAAYVAAVWLVANWVIMGGPLHFWRMTLAGTPYLPAKGMDLWLQPILIIAFTVMPLLPALLYGDLRPLSLSRAGVPVAWLGVAALFSPLLFPTLRTQAQSPALWAPLMPMAAAAAAFGFCLLLTLAASVRETPPASRQRLLSPGFVLMAIGCLAMAYYMQSNHMGLPTGFRSTLTGYAASAHTDLDERQAAARLQGTLQPTMRNYIAGWPGFAIALYSGQTQSVEVLPNYSPPPGDLGLQAGSVVVLLSNGDDALPAWEARLPRFLSLKQEWTAGKWTGYRVVVGETRSTASNARGASFELAMPSTR